MKGNQTMFEIFRCFSAKIMAIPAKAKRRKVNNVVTLANKMNVKSGFKGMKNEEKVAK
jgi:hypothetical protein